MASVRDMETKHLKELLKHKRSYSANDSTSKEQDHQAAEALRKMYKITKDRHTADEIEAIINERTKPTVSISEPSPRGSSYSYYDPQAEIRRMAELKKQKAIAELGKAKDNSLSNLSKEEGAIKPKYYNARNNVSTQSKMNARNFAEYYAQNGLNKSGENTQARIANNVALQNSIGELKESESEAFADIARRRTDINNAYNSDVASANAGIDANTMQMLINQHNADRAYRLQQEQQALNESVAKANMTGIYNGQQTMQSKNSDRNYLLQKEQQQATLESRKITDEINKLKLQNLPYELKGQLQLLQQKLESGNMSLDKAKYEYNQLVDPNSDYNKMKGLEYKSKLADIAYKNKLTSNIGADNRTADQKEMDRLKLQQLKTKSSNPQSTQKDEALGLAYQSMINAENPQQWLNQNAPFLTANELKWLKSQLSE
ncbi:MAG: hypothetical protein N4A63_05160 [Vallitalea sp.]|nr:hypothetical protein [Vallitalea sp.]